jgi:hypothetical protein
MARRVDARRMRFGLVVIGATVAVAWALAGLSASPSGAARPGAMNLVISYQPPPGDPGAAFVGGRAWTYDSAVTAAALAAQGDVDRSGALLDQLQTLQRTDGALALSYDVATGRGAGPPRSGVLAWAGLAAMQWRNVTCSGRHDLLIAGVARWLLDRRITDRRSVGFGLLTGGRDVRWASTEHNLEARAFLAALAATLDGRVADPTMQRPCQPGLDGLAPHAARRLSGDLHEAVDDVDVAIGRDLFVRDTPEGAHLRQGLDDDVRPVDVQALGILWLLGQGRTADARDVETSADATMSVHGRTVRWRSAAGETFSGYRPYAGAAGPDVLWMEGTLQMRMAKAQLGSDTAALDDSIGRWAALTGPDVLLQADRTGGEDYRVWPAAAPAAWLRLSRSGFSLLS